MDVLASESLWRAWSFPPLVLGAAGVAIVFFLLGWRRLRGRRPELAPWTRIPLFAGGVLVSVLALVSPLDAIGERYLQSAHMVQHLLVADLGIAMIVVAVRGPLVVFCLPRDLLAPLARARPLRQLVRALLRPAVSYAVWVAVLVAWHVPALYEAALRSRVWHDAEHLSFVLAGVLIWTQIADPSRSRRLTVSERLGYTALVFWSGQVLSYVVLFAFAPLYPVYEAEPVRLLGLSPLADQRLAGLAMMVEQTATLGLAFLILLRASRRRQRERALTAPRRQPAG